MFRWPDGYPDVPALRRYRGRPIAEVEQAARRAFLLSILFMFVGATLFAEAILGFLPGLGFAERFAILIPAMVLFFVGVLLGAMWNFLDSALYRAPPPRLDGAHEPQAWVAIHAVVASVGGVTTAFLIGLAQALYPQDPSAVLLAIAATLAATLGGLVLVEARRRHRRLVPLALHPR